MPEDFQPPVHIGLSTGHVYMGIVGGISTSSELNRKEIVMLGETVERAFLMMQTATKVYGQIFMDYETK